MRWLFSFLFLLFIIMNILSCNRANVVNDSVVWPRESFVKFEVWIYKDSCTKENNKDCNKKLLGYTGSGSTIARTFDGSYILTAAHICNRKKDIRKLQEESKLLEEKVKYKTRFLVRDINDFSYKAEIVDYNNRLDTCVAFVWGLFNPALTISKEKPTIGSTYYNMSAPAGYFGENLIPLFKGFYSGIDTGDAVYTIPAIGGSSGSPIINRNGELVGMIYARHREFHHIILSPAHKKLKRFLFNSIKKDSRKRAKKLAKPENKSRQIIINFKN